MLDIYFDKNYGKLYEDHEDGIAEQFVHESRHGKITNLFIKKEIPIHINSKKYYDITTPYGYGGPVIVYTSNKEKLVQEYEQAFQEHCDENNIIAEFVRFHPIMENALDFQAVYNSEYIRKTVGTNLAEYDDPFQEEFSKSCRKNVRKSLKNGVDYVITEKPSSIDQFLKIYYSTMKRNKANDYYYFNEDYFQKSLKYFQNNIITVEAIYENVPIAMGFYFVFNDYIHIHLSGTLSEYLNLSPAYILRYGVTQWGKEKGYKLIHHGGGRTNDLDDSLYKFKNQFGKNTNLDFYIGKKVWNQSIYNELCEIKKIDAEVEFFPAYRA